METTCGGVLGHYSLLDGMISDRACAAVGPVKRGAWRWGITTTSGLVEQLWSTQVKMAGVVSLGAHQKGLCTRERYGMPPQCAETTIVAHTCVAVSQIRATSHAVS